MFIYIYEIRENIRTKKGEKYDKRASINRMALGRVAASLLSILYYTIYTLQCTCIHKWMAPII